MECTDNQEDTEVHAPAHISQIQNVLQKWHPGSMVFTLTPQQTEILKCACEPKLQKAPCRRRTREASPRAGKFGDLITADHKVFDEECESRSSGTSFCHSMDSTVSVQNKNFSGDGKEFTKVSRAVPEAKSCLH